MSPPLILQGILAERLEQIASVIRSVMPSLEAKLVMGGGSVLAARWQHRQSTDIDLFTTERDMQQLLQEADYLEMLAVIAQRASEVGASPELPPQETPEADPQQGSIHGSICGTPFTLYPSAYIRPYREPTPFIGKTRIQAATSAEILSGKLMGRVYQNPDKPDLHKPIPIRDLFDFAVAALKEPGLMQSIFDRLSAPNLAIIADRIASLPANLYELDPHPIIDPQLEVVLVGLPQAVAQAVQRGDEVLLPNAKPVFEAVEDGPNVDGATESH